MAIDITLVMIEIVKDCLAMARYTLILLAVWGTYALATAMEVDGRTVFFATLLPSIYILGMRIMRDRETA